MRDVRISPCRRKALDALVSSGRKGGQLTVRLETVCALGGRCTWPDCSVTDTDMLEVAHVNGNGAEERRKFAHSYTGVANTMGKVQEFPNKSEAYYRNIIANADSGEYTLYCANHHRKMDALHRMEKRNAIKGCTLC